MRIFFFLVRQKDVQLWLVLQWMMLFRFIMCMFFCVFSISLCFWLGWMFCCRVLNCGLDFCLFMVLSVCFIVVWSFFGFIGFRMQLSVENLIVLMVNFLWVVIKMILKFFFGMVCSRLNLDLFGIWMFRNIMFGCFFLMVVSLDFIFFFFGMVVMLRLNDLIILVMSLCVCCLLLMIRVFFIGLKDKNLGLNLVIIFLGYNLFCINYFFVYFGMED